MVLADLSKGKKRAYEETRASSSSLSPVPPDSPKVKKSKRAQTRRCPVCDELIPLRLLAAHGELESKRLEEIISNVGSSDFQFDIPDEGPGPNSRSRRSALRARKSLSAMNPRNNNPMDTLEQAVKAIQTIKRRRKQRHAKLREIAREEEEEESNGQQIWSARIERGQIVCPVCLLAVGGDQDVLDAHVDACLADQSRRLEEAQQREQEVHRGDETDWEDAYDMEGATGHVGNARGTGFYTRNRNEQDIDDEVDVDGEDQAFGDAQFTEGDILSVNRSRTSAAQDIEIEDEGGGEEQEDKTLRDLVAEGKIVRRTACGDGMDDMKLEVEDVMGVGDADKMDRAISAARGRGDMSSLIIALESKVKQLETMRVSSSTSLLCRICLDPYNEPTASTGCWHTCCRECWLRCLGSTKLCPICKRITGATDLRRIYI